MSTFKIAVAEGLREPRTIRLEKKKQNPEDPLEYVEHVRGEVLVLPAPKGRVTRVSVGPLDYHVVSEPYDVEKKTLLHCHVDEAESTLTLSPYPPLPEATIVVECEDGR